MDTAYGEDYTRTIETEVSIISIRPNPSADKLTVQVTRVDFKKNLRFTIHDLSGKAITNGNHKWQYGYTAEEHLSIYS